MCVSGVSDPGANRWMPENIFPDLIPCTGDGAVKTKKRLQHMILSCISRACSATPNDADASQGLQEGFQVPYTLALSAVDHMTLELDFSPTDMAAGEISKATSINLIAFPKELCLRSCN